MPIEDDMADIDDDMPREDGTVWITNHPGEAIYINGLYGRSAGAAPGPFVVPFALTTFETLDANTRPVSRGRAQPTPEEPDIDLELDPV